MLILLYVKSLILSREAFEHANVVFNDNGTVTAIPVHPLKYMPEMSNGTEEDILILPNIALFVSIINILFSK